MAARPSPQSLPGIALLEQTPIIIEKILATATDEQMHWKPAPDRWSISEVLAHLSDAEMQVFRARVERMMKEKDPVVESHDQDGAYKRGEYSKGTGRENLRKFCHERDRSLSLLRYLPLEALGRTAQHAQIGRVTIEVVLNEWALHDLGHVRQIVELFRAKAFHPNTGPYQKFYTLKP